MKNIIIALIFIMSSIGITKAQEVQKAKIIIATYSGSSTDGYYFTNDLDQKNIIFAQIDSVALNKYDLSISSFLNRTFRVAYVNDTDEDNTIPDAKGPKKIIDLTLIEQTEEE